MKQRGRPPSPGLLTPREEEVLALIREGRSNREIATELGISLQGVKYHVTEILGKLGVESREEAAVWDARPARRWAFLPLPAFASWAETLPSFLTPKLAMASFAGLAALVLTGAVLIAEGAGRGAATGLAALAPTPTPTAAPTNACQLASLQVTDRAMPICMVHESVRTEFTTLEEAAAIASFVPVLPSYVPAGFESRTLIHTRPGVTTLYYPGGRGEQVESPFKGPHYDSLFARFERDDGNYLAVTQGYYDVAPTGWYDIAPDGMKGSVHLAGKELRWVKGGPNPTTAWEPNEHGGVRPVPAGWDNGGIRLYWTMSTIETGTWEAGTDGVRRDVTRPLEYVVSSDVLPLDELLKVAESVLQSP